MRNLIRKTFSVPPLGCNCSILGDEETKQAIVVDPGGDARRILDEVQRLGLVITGIYHTHAHFDHFLASGEIRHATQAPMGIHEADLDLWKILEVQCRMFGVPFVQAPDPDYCLRDEEVLSFGTIKGQALHTPGHTPGSMCFHFPQDHLLLSGDTLFRGGIGRTDLWGGDSRAIEESIRERLFSLDEITTVITGHGAETQIGFEQQYNPFVSG